MKYNMHQWLDSMHGPQPKKPLPILSFPAVQLLNIDVKTLIGDMDLQAYGMKAIADRVPSAASVSLMDLSVEAECFGAPIRISADEVPTVTAGIVFTMEDAVSLRVPAVGEGRTGICVCAIEKAVALITDRPVFAGVIGPYSLAGRLIDVTQIMYECYDSPEMVHTVLEKVADFLIIYCNAFKAAGANGVIMAEPLAGLLSPALAEEFSCKYVKHIVDSTQADDFIVIYHNCGNAVPAMLNEILATGCSAYHFGNAISMPDILNVIPSDIVCMGNIDPAAQFRNGTQESIQHATKALLEACRGHNNFVLSSGCDIPPLSKWENIDAFFQAALEP